MDDSVKTGETAEDRAFGDKLLAIVESKTDDEWAKIDGMKLYGIDPADAEARPTHAGRKVTVGAFRAMERIKDGTATPEDLDKAGLYMHGITSVIKSAFTYIASGGTKS